MSDPPQFNPFARQDAGELVADALVLAKHVANLPAAHADVARGHVGVGADVAGQFGHEALAEAHHFVVAFSLGVEVGPSLAAAHGQGGQGVLEDLFKAQKLEDAQVHGGVEAQAAFVGADGAVELHAEPAVDVHLSGVVRPRHAEHQDPLGLDDALEDAGVFVLGVGFHEGHDGLGDLLHGLQKFGFVGVALGNSIHERLDGVVVICVHRRID